MVVSRPLYMNLLGSVSFNKGSLNYNVYGNIRVLYPLWSRPCYTAAKQSTYALFQRAIQALFISLQPLSPEPHPHQILENRLFSTNRNRMPPSRAVIVEYDVVWTDTHTGSERCSDGTLTITSNHSCRAANIPCVAIFVWGVWKATFETEWNPEKEQAHAFHFQTMNEAMDEDATDIPNMEEVGYDDRGNMLLCVSVEAMCQDDTYHFFRFWLKRRVDQEAPVLSEREMKRLEIKMENAEGSEDEEDEEDYDDDEEVVTG